MSVVVLPLRPEAAPRRPLRPLGVAWALVFLLFVDPSAHSGNRSAELGAEVAGPSAARPIEVRQSTRRRERAPFGRGRPGAAGTNRQVHCRKGDFACGTAASVLADVRSRDGLVDTSDDDYRLAAGSPAQEAGADLVLQLPEIAPALLRPEARRRPGAPSASA